MSYGDPTTEGAHRWALADDEAQPFFRQAIELGITFWEPRTPTRLVRPGRKSSAAATGARYSRREDIVLATKVFGKMHDGPGGSGLSRKAIMEQIDASLTRLGTDYVDLYQIHRFDPATPVAETMEALHNIVKAGKVRYLGASSMYAWQFAKLQHAADQGSWTRFVSMQNQYNLLRRQDEPELMAMCADTGVGLVPYSPQGKGRLARPWGEQSTRSSVDHVVQAFDSPLDEPVVNAVQKLAHARGVSMAQVALAWVLHNPAVSAPIVGATKPHHLPEAIAALELKLTGRSKSLTATMGRLVLTNTFVRVRECAAAHFAERTSDGAQTSGIIMSSGKPDRSLLCAWADFGNDMMAETSGGLSVSKTCRFPGSSRRDG